MNSNEIIVRNFFPPRISQDPNLYSSMLGWGEREKFEAGSNDSRKIFEYFVLECGMNLAFYYTIDGKFYGIHREEEPIEFLELPLVPNWDGNYIWESCHSNTHEEGRTLCFVDDPNDLWDSIRIKGKSLDYILAHSFITSLK